MSDETDTNSDLPTQCIPVQEYLGALPAWDETPRAADLFHRYFGAEDSEYTRWVSWAFLSACVSRALSPGSVCRLVPVIKGAQNTGKTSGIRALGGDYYDSITKADISDKDSRLSAGRAWIVELEEMPSARASDIDHFKAFLSAQDDRSRPPYGKTVVVRPRGCVFIASGNHDEYLVDVTGETRYYPIDTGPVDVEALARDRDQLFAEIKAAGLNDCWWVPSPNVAELRRIG